MFKIRIIFFEWTEFSKYSGSESEPGITTDNTKIVLSLKELSLLPLLSLSIEVIKETLSFLRKNTLETTFSIPLPHLLPRYLNNDLSPRCCRLTQSTCRNLS